MANRLPFIIKDEKVIFNGDYMEAYIPEKLFNGNLNEFYGDKVKMMGIFNVRFGKNREVDPKSPLFSFIFPTMITSEPTSNSVIETELTPGSGVQKYVLLRYMNGDVMMSQDLVMDIANVDKFVNMILTARIPNTIPYETILTMFYKNLEYNNETCNVSGVNLSVCVSEQCRSKKDQSIQFRKIIGKGGNTSNKDYVMNNVRAVCANNSTFAALTFEDQDRMLVHSVLRERKNKKQSETPIEQLIRL